MLVVGGEAKRRSQMAQRNGEVAIETEQPGVEPDVLEKPHGELVAPAEVRRRASGTPSSSTRSSRTRLRNGARASIDATAGHRGKPCCGASTPCAQQNLHATFPNEMTADGPRGVWARQPAARVPVQQVALDPVDRRPGRGVALLLGRRRRPARVPRSPAVPAGGSRLEPLRLAEPPARDARVAGDGRARACGSSPHRPAAVRRGACRPLQLLPGGGACSSASSGSRSTARRRSPAAWRSPAGRSTTTCCSPPPAMAERLRSAPEAVGPDHDGQRAVDEAGPRGVEHGARRRSSARRGPRQGRRSRNRRRRQHRKGTKVRRRLRRTPSPYDGQDPASRRHRRHARGRARCVAVSEDSALMHHGDRAGP